MTTTLALLAGSIVAAGTFLGATPVNAAEIPTVTCTTDPAILNTGFNSANGGIVPDGGEEERWTVAGGTTGVFGPAATSPRDLTTLPPADVEYLPADVGKINKLWADSPYGNAQWISANFEGQQNQATDSYGDWYYRYQFTLADEVDPSRFSLSMDWMADNNVFGVWVNDVPQAGENLPQFPATPYRGGGFLAGNAAQTDLSSGWRTGLNTILVQVKSYYPAEGFVAQVQSAAFCPQLAVEKTSDATAETRVGDTVTYTVTATNTGTGDYTTNYPAVFADDLAGVLDDATYNQDAVATLPGDVSYESPLLSWVGELPAGESVELTYTVTLKAGGDGRVRNVAWQPGDPDASEPPECDAPVDGIDPVTGEPCDGNEFDLPRLRIEKSADRTELPAVGEPVEYTVTVTNEGPGVYTDDAPATFTDDLSDVLDAADFNDDASASAGAVSYDERD